MQSSCQYPGAAASPSRHDSHSALQGVPGPKEDAGFLQCPNSRVRHGTDNGRRKRRTAHTVRSFVGRHAYSTSTSSIAPCANSGLASHQPRVRPSWSGSSTLEKAAKIIHEFMTAGASGGRVERPVRRSRRSGAPVRRCAGALVHRPSPSRNRADDGRARSSECSSKSNDSSRRPDCAHDRGTARRQRWSTGAAFVEGMGRRSVLRGGCCAHGSRIPHRTAFARTLCVPISSMII